MAYLLAQVHQYNQAAFKYGQAGINMCICYILELKPYFQVLDLEAGTSAGLELPSSSTA